MLDLRQGVQREFARAASIGLATGQAVASTRGGLLHHRKADGSRVADPAGKQRPRSLLEPSNLAALKAARRHAQVVLSEMHALERRAASAATRRSLG
ncbi:MAG: hypothetical protein ACLP8S_05400 [Solirubrobacteraceae bacterium]